MDASLLFPPLLCRAPNPDTVLIVETPKGTFSTKSLLQSKRHMGARLISTSRLKLEEPSPEDTEEVDPFSAARCRVYKRTKKVHATIVFHYAYLTSYNNFMYPILIFLSYSCLLADKKGGHSSPNYGTSSSSYECNTEFKCKQSKFHQPCNFISFIYFLTESLLLNSYTF